MKKYIVLIASFTFLISCKKKQEYSCEGCIQKVDTVHLTYSVTHEGLPQTWHFGETIVGAEIDKMIKEEIQVNLSYTINGVERSALIPIVAGTKNTYLNAIVIPNGWTDYTAKVISVIPNKGKDWIITY